MQYIHFRSGGYSREHWDHRPIAVSVGYNILRNEDSGTFYIAGNIARCSSRDQFNKKIARAIIDGRNKKYGYQFREPLDDNWSHADIYNLLLDLYHPDR